MVTASSGGSDGGVQRPRTLRYRATMKKSDRKLQLRSETIRALRELDHLELRRAIGGEDLLRGESGNNCPAMVAAAVVATTPFG